MTESQAELLAGRLYHAHADGNPANTVENRARFGLMLRELLKRHNASPPEMLSRLQDGQMFIRSCTKHALHQGVPEQEIRALYAFCFT